jgi:type VI secretion system protein VasI
MRTIFSLAGLLIASPAFAVEALDICIHTENDLDRLACYDKISGRSPEITSLATSGNWLIKKETSKLTDDTNVYMTVRSDEIINCGWNKGDNIILTLRCMENTTAFIITTDCHMTSSEYNDYGDVTYRIDDQKARTVSMEESTDSKALGLWSGEKSIPVIKQLFSGKQLITRMTPFSQSPFTATFNIEGLEAASRPLREACGW